MHSGIKYAFIFSLGGAVGAAVTYGILKPMYERKVQEEVDAFKEYWSGRKVQIEEEQVAKAVESEKAVAAANRAEYSSILAEEGYTGNSEEKGGSESMKNFGPKVITPEEFGEIESYETICLTYYADGVLTDDRDEPVEDIDETVGFDFADHFGEYEPDSVFIRNNRLKADFEILADIKTYAEVKYDMLNPMDDE